MALMLKSDRELEESDIVANCRMNRERDLRGSNGYDVELRIDPIAVLQQAASTREPTRTVRWLDLCCGTGRALIQAAKEIQRRKLGIEIIGVDLVSFFAPHQDCSELTLVQANLSEWNPAERFELITCVHGLHYIGDKLRLITRCRSWLNDDGIIAANFDAASILVEGKTSRFVIRQLRQAGWNYDSRRKLISATGSMREQDAMEIPVEYLGADDSAGPNYTGQPAVVSHYRLLESGR